MDKQQLEQYFKSNQENWNQKVGVHKDSSFYDLDGFKLGKNMLNDIELKEVGDVEGKSLLHLQCHFGLDTMSWSRLGAKSTGIDFSDEAIKLASDLNDELQLNTNFICCNVYDLPKHLDEQFDIVFASYGVIGWLPDLKKWGDIVSRFLKPGGKFYMAEFHPFVWMLDDDFKKIHYSYFNTGVIVDEQEGTYADRSSDIKHKEYSWNHSISDVINALITNGLSVDFMHEYDYSPYNCFPNTIKREGGKFFIQGFEGILPMVYSIQASKK